MKGNTAEFIEDVNLGKVSSHGLFEGVAHFEAAIKCPVQHLWLDLSNYGQFMLHLAGIKKISYLVR